MVCGAGRSGSGDCPWPWGAFSSCSAPSWGPRPCPPPRAHRPPRPVPPPRTSHRPLPAGPAGPALGASAGESLLRLYDVVKVTAGYIAAIQLQPGGGSVAPGGDSGWKPRAPIKAPPVSPVPPAVPARDPTKYDILGEAYRKASDSLSDRCHLPFALLMAIGEVESSSLRGRKLDAGHNVVPPVLGPQLSGGGFAAIGDSDGGRLDGDPAWDRAVGPMQFIPGTWRLWGADGNGDGVADPQNVEDAALAAGRYLCAGGTGPVPSAGPRGGDPLLQPLAQVPCHGARPVRLRHERPRRRTLTGSPPCRAAGRFPPRRWDSPGSWTAVGMDKWRLYISLHDRH